MIDPKAAMAAELEETLFAMYEKGRRDGLELAARAVLDCNDRGRDTSAWQEAVLPILEDAVKRVRAVNPKVKR